MVCKCKSDKSVYETLCVTDDACYAHFYHLKLNGELYIILLTINKSFFGIFASL